MPELIVKLGDQTLQTCRFEGELLRIGRSRENDVVLENLSVSRHHAQLRFHDGRYVLTDLNSGNGTLVNGVRITKTEVVDQDIITIGKHKLHFHHQKLHQLPDDESTSIEQQTVMVEPRSEAWLEISSGRLKGREFKITRFETSLGKAPSNDVVLTDDWLLGKKQAIIVRKGNRSFEIYDLGGLRRVKVNGTTVQERADLNDGDRVELGGTSLIFHASDIPAKPTGRVPRELLFDTPASARKGADSSAKISADAPPEANEASQHFMDNFDSLDLEDDAHYDSVEIKAEPSGPSESAPTPVPDQQPRVTAARSELAEAAPAPAAAESASADGNRNNGAMAGAVNEHHKRNIFDDVKSGPRRMRKHHQRAAQKQESPDAVGNSAAARPSADGVEVDKEPTAPVSTTPNEKEIQIWEAALKNASPAIRRQAARMLKKLTGRDYEV